MADQSNEMIDDGWKNADSRPARNGWAPGFYIGPCGKCGQKFFGSKRSRTCADCAYAEPEPAPPADQSNEMGMVEKVAAAMEARRGELSNWRLQRCYAELARAAIEAMREPTPAMIDSCGHGECAVWARSAWGLMIDAALKTSTPEKHDEVKG